jgi:hypothetical protein
MQNGGHSSTGGLAGSLRASGGLGTRADDVGAQDGAGHRSMLVRSDAAIRGRSDRRSGSIRSVRGPTESDPTNIY